MGPVAVLRIRAAVPGSTRRRALPLGGPIHRWPIRPRRSRSGGLSSSCCSCVSSSGSCRATVPQQAARRRESHWNCGPGPGSDRAGIPSPTSCSVAVPAVATPASAQLAQVWKRFTPISTSRGPFTQQAAASSWSEEAGRCGTAGREGSVRVDPGSAGCRQQQEWQSAGRPSTG